MTPLRVAASALPRQALAAQPLLRPPGGRAVKARWQSTSAHDAAQQLLRDKPQPACRTEILDGVQLQKLSLTLGRRQLWPGLDVARDPPPAGTPVPPGYHLVYFTPAFVEADLGLDGTDKSFNPPAPFTRRMWAGGSMSWNRAELLRVGQAVEERTSLRSAVAKKSRDGGEMVLVEVWKEFWALGGRAPIVVDKRNWIFRPEVSPASDAAAAEPALDTIVHGPSTCVDVATDRICDPLRTWSPMARQDVDNNHSLTLGSKVTIYPERRVRWSPVGLFRFSALTFNGHRIHYDGGWTRRVEQHPAPVVHAPLNLMGMLDYWRDACGADSHGSGDALGPPPARLAYRARAPLYAGDEYTMQAAGGGVVEKDDAEAAGEAGMPVGSARRWDVSVQRGATLCMTGTIHTTV